MAAYQKWLLWKCIEQHKIQCKCPQETESMQNYSLCASDPVREVQITVVAHPDEGAMSQDNQINENIESPQ